MSIEEQYKKKNLYVQNNIKKEIEKVEKRISNKDLVQLKTILGELENILEKKGLSIGFPQFVIDSWDFRDELGMELLSLAELYKRWK